MTTYQQLVFASGRAQDGGIIEGLDQQLHFETQEEYLEWMLSRSQPDV